MKRSYLVVGGSSGIGLAVAKRLSQENCHVIIVGANRDKLEKAFQDIGENCIPYAYDLEDNAHICMIFDFIKSQKIKLQGMVFCAGIAPLVLLKDCTPDIAQQVFRINYFSFLECTKFFYDEDISYDGSKIVVITSTTAHASGYRQALYGSSKSAIISAARLMAKELLNREIRINCISPGCVRTELLSGLYQNEEELNEKVLSRQPLGIIPPEKVAELACLLLSPLSDYITGTEIIYDGGLLLG